MRRALLALVLFAPSLALAAGFAPQSIFLSKSPVVAGDTVRIYAIVSNASTAAFSGMVSISEGTADIGSVAVTLAAGATQTASVLWKPIAGSHTITAEIKAADGSVAETKSETFTVEAPPPPASTADNTAQSTTTVESSAGIQQQIGSVSPQVAGAVAPAFAFIDGVRQSIASAADQQIAQTQPKITPALAGQVEGASTEAPSNTGWVWSIVYTIYFYILTLVRFVVGSAAVFYPVLAIVFLYFMWKMFRKFRRPAY